MRTYTHTGTYTQGGKETHSVWLSAPEPRPMSGNAVPEDTKPTVH